MGFLDRFKQLVAEDDSHLIDIYAPLSGEIVKIEDVPDVVFSEKIVGDGVAINPTSRQIVAPISGRIGKIFETNHAFVIESPDNIELFIHFGVNSVELKGSGFTRLKEEGDEVEIGDPIIEIDLEFLKSEAKSILTPVVVSNMHNIYHLVKLSGIVEAGQTPIMRVNK